MSLRRRAVLAAGLAAAAWPAHRARLGCKNKTATTS